MHPDDIFASNIIEKYRNQPGNIHLMSFEDLVSSYVSKKAGNVPVEPDEMKIYILPISSADNVELNRNIVVLTNELGEMWKCS